MEIMECESSTPTTHVVIAPVQIIVFVGFDMPLMKLPIFVRADYTMIEAEKTLKNVTLQAALVVLVKGPLTDRLESVEEVNRFHQRE